MRRRNEKSLWLRCALALATGCSTPADGDAVDAETHDAQSEGGALDSATEAGTGDHDAARARDAQIEAGAFDASLDATTEARLDSGAADSALDGALPDAGDVDECANGTHNCSDVLGYQWVVVADDACIVAFNDPLGYAHWRRYHCDASSVGALISIEPGTAHLPNGSYPSGIGVGEAFGWVVGYCSIEGCVGGALGSCGEPGARRILRCTNTPDDSGTCTNTVEGFVCTCPSGYSSPDDGVTCLDVDECLIDNGGCGASEFWSCKNNVGAPNTCADVDECLTDNGGCGPRAAWTCTNNEGAPPTCTDVDECLTDNGGCSHSPMVACTNTPGSRTCGPCPTGFFSPSEGQCEDIQECNLDETQGGCDDDPIAMCRNLYGSFTCSCPGGYTGTGVGPSGCTPM